LAAVAGRRQGYAWQFALPTGYETTFLGLAVCLVAGVSDMIKHSLWGFEQGFNALLSPTHLAIGAGMFLIAAGPIRSGLARRRDSATLVDQLPLILSAASMMELLHWGTQFIFMTEAERFNAPLSPTSIPHWTLTLLTLQYDKQGIGLLAVIVQSILVTGFFLYLGRRRRLAIGANTVLLVVGNAFIAAANANFLGQFLAVISASFVGGAIADGFRLDPENQLSVRWSVASVVVPAAYWIMTLLMLAVTMGGIWWSPDVISGSVVFAGFVGFLLNALTGPFKQEI
jgi:hypothetical protein